MDPYQDKSEPARAAAAASRLLIFGAMLALGIVANVRLAPNGTG